MVPSRRAWVTFATASAAAAMALSSCHDTGGSGVYGTARGGVAGSDHSISGAGGDSDEPATGGSSAEGGAPAGGAPAGGAPAGGMPGDGGDGGDGGTGGGGPCQIDEDCSDGAACTGVEQCVDGSCQPGDPPCENPDPANCEAPCAEPVAAGAPVVCAPIRGLDSDGDDHRSAACEEDPGDDCDDSRELVHPQADEICDGLDNDCDGLADLDDGLTLSGSAEVLRVIASYSSIAWSPVHEVYGIAFTANPPIGNLFPQNVYYSAIDPDNVPTLSPTPVSAYEGAGEATGATAIAWRDGYFGVAYRSPQNQVLFRRVTFDGLMQPVREVDPSAGAGAVFIDLAAIAGGNWALVWHESFIATDIIKARTVDDADVVSAEFPIDGTPNPPAVGVRLALSNDHFGVVWRAEDEQQDHSIQFSVRSSAFAPLDTQTVSVAAAASNPVIAGNADGFAVAHADGTSVVFEQFDVDGNSSCGPMKLPVTGFVPHDMVATELGFLIVSGAGQVEALEVLDGCEFRQRFTLDDSPAVAVQIASGGDRGFGVVWETALVVADSEVKTRTFGPHFCD